MKLYTKTGDTGRTSLIGGRVYKDDMRVTAYGTLDELNSFVGQAIAQLDAEKFNVFQTELLKIQHELFDCGGELATITDSKHTKLTGEEILYLEERIDQYTKEAPPLQKFILPGGSLPASTIHIARTVTRRAEREIVQLMRSEDVHEYVLQYINRLSDYFFALSRVINARMQIADIEYERSANVFHTEKEIDCSES